MMQVGRGRTQNSCPPARKFACYRASLLPHISTSLRSTSAGRESTLLPSVLSSPLAFGLALHLVTTSPPALASPVPAAQSPQMWTSAPLSLSQGSHSCTHIPLTMAKAISGPFTPPPPLPFNTGLVAVFQQPLSFLRYLKIMYSSDYFRHDPLCSVC